MFSLLRRKHSGGGRGGGGGHGGGSDAGEPLRQPAPSYKQKTDSDQGV